MTNRQAVPEPSPVDPADGADGADDEREIEEADLRASLDALSTVATGKLALDDLLREVATFAVQAIPGADGAGLTLLEADRPDLVVTTAPFVREVDDIQYSIGQGPCITAAVERQTVISGSLGGDSRWPRFGARVARLGVHSAVSLPLLTSDAVVGALNVYAHGKHVFDERAAELGRLFAVPAAIAVQNAQVLAQTQRLASQLQRALDSRGTIDRAIGIVMSRSGDTEEQALARLRTLSQHEHRKLVAVAQGIVDEAVRRARARHAAGS
jgi:GAF domain-containing protein